VFKDKFNDVYAGMDKYEEFNEFCVQLMAHGKHIGEYRNVYGFINRRRYGLTIVGEISIEGFFSLFAFIGFLAKNLVKEGHNLKTLKNTISKYIEEYNITEWLDENKFEIIKK